MIESRYSCYNIVTRTDDGTEMKHLYHCITPDSMAIKKYINFQTIKLDNLLSNISKFYY